MKSIIDKVFTFIFFNNAYRLVIVRVIASFYWFLPTFFEVVRMLREYYMLIHTHISQIFITEYQSYPHIRI